MTMTRLFTYKIQGACPQQIGYGPFTVEAKNRTEARRIILTKVFAGPQLGKREGFNPKANWRIQFIEEGR